MIPLGGAQRRRLSLPPREPRPLLRGGNPGLCWLRLSPPSPRMPLFVFLFADKERFGINLAGSHLSLVQYFVSFADFSDLKLLLKLLGGSTQEVMTLNDEHGGKPLDLRQQKFKQI